MIHNTFLIRISTKEILASTKYWPVDVAPEVLNEYVTTREELRSADSDDAELSQLALIVGDHKFHGVDLVSDVLLLFVTDKGEDEASIFEKVESASIAMRKKLSKSGLDAVKEEYEKLLEPSVTTRLKIALVGEGGVGKTTTLHLLLGETPPLQYVPTIALNLETVENIRFGNYSLVLWDFAGQERFRTLWRFYFHGADVIFLVCDSALRNVIISKDILKLIKRDAPKVPVFALANKQDKPNAMKSEVVQKILGIPTYPMVAIDKARRDEMLRILMTAAAQYVGVALPDLPASELLKFTDAATEKAIAETDAMEERREAEEIKASAEEDEYETIEVVEEVLIDEDGHIIENLEDYEIVEEVIEEVEDDIFDEEMEEEAVAPEQPAEAMIEDLDEAEAKVEEAIFEPEVGEEVAAPEQSTEVMIEDLDEAEAKVEVSISEPEVEEEVSAPEEPTEVMIEDFNEAEVEVSVSESEVEEEVETSPLEVDVSPEHIIHREIELAETDASIAQEQRVEDEAFEVPAAGRIEASGKISTDMSDEKVSIEVEESSLHTGLLHEELPPEEMLEIEPVIEQNNGDVKLAKEIIFEALEADEFISAELDHVSHAEIDEALEAFKSDEAIPTEGESDIREEIDAESLEELELILGPLDSAVGGTKKKETVEADQHSENSPINNESLDELSRLLDFVDSGDDEE